MTAFTDEEKKILAPYFTNVDKPIYAFTGRVPEEVVAVLFSKYSRSKGSLRKNFLTLVKDPDSGFRQILDAVGQGETGGFSTALEKARDFFQRILVGYGDDSVGELGIAHISCEDVSNIASKRLEDARLTSPLEKSTRYVIFDKDKFLREPRIAKSEFADEYESVNQLLLGTYARQVEPMIAFVKERWPMSEFDTGQYSDDAQKKRVLKAYEAAVRAKALDVLRYYMPASTLTNVGITANGRGFEYLISKLLSDELEEVRNIGKMMHEELSKVIPSLVKRASSSAYYQETRVTMRHLTSRVCTDSPAPAGTVTLVDYDKDAEQKVVAAALYGFTILPLHQLKDKATAMSDNERAEVIRTYIDRRTNRREKPMRAAETAYYTFDILSDYGAYRDLQRHRMLTQIAQPLTVAHGYDTPPELSEAGFADAFHDCMKKAADVYWKLFQKFPHEAQYVVPFAYKIRYLFTINLRSLFHLIELRSMPQGHPSYRQVVQEMYHLVNKVHPGFAQYMRYVYLDNRDALGRLKGELRSQEKLARMGGKEVELE